MQQSDEDRPSSGPPGTKCKQCGRPMGPLPPSAKHKTFCSQECRQRWHLEYRKRAIALMEQQEKEQGQ